MLRSRCYDFSTVLRKNILYASPNITKMIKSRRMRWTGHVVRMEEKRDAYKILVGKREGKIPLGRPWHRWEDNIRMDLRVGGRGLNSSGSE
jgi:hypothetical protein